MMVTAFSFLMAILWFNIFVLLSYMIRKKTGMLLQYSLFPLLIFSAVGLIRVLIPLEFPFTVVVQSQTLMPYVQNILDYKVLVFGIQCSVLWGLVVLCVVVGTVLFVRFVWDMRRSEAVISLLYTEEDARANAIMQRVIDQSTPGKVCKVLIAPDLKSPIVTGLLLPVVLIPEGCRTFTDKQLEYVLRHEWCHFESRDLWTKLWIHILCCFMWWNPLVYLLRKNLDQVLELKCDERVTRTMSERERLAYLETLLMVLKQRPEGEPTLAVNAAFLGGNTHEDTVQRFKLIYDSRLTRASWKTNLVVICVMAVLFVGSYSFVLQPYTSVVENGIEVYDQSSYITITPENSYLQQEEDGTFSMYVNGQFFETLKKEDLNAAPYNELPIS